MKGLVEDDEGLEVVDLLARIVVTRFLAVTGFTVFIIGVPDLSRPAVGDSTSRDFLFRDFSTSSSRKNVVFKRVNIWSAKM